VLTAITRAVLALSTGGVWIHALMRVDGRRRSGCVGPARFEQWVAVRDDVPAASRFAPRPKDKIVIDCDWLKKSPPASGFEPRSSGECHCGERRRG
jgi:hypothetical protein